MHDFEALLQTSCILLALVKYKMMNKKKNHTAALLSELSKHR